jgi:hypothetical protein
MNPSVETHPFDALTSALGGRRLYSVLWGLWLFFAMCGHYALMLPRREVVTGGGKIATTVGIAGLLVYLCLLIRGLASKERRAELFTKQSDAPPVRIVFRVLVWTIPVLGLGALLAPVLIK